MDHRWVSLVEYDLLKNTGWEGFTRPIHGSYAVEQATVACWNVLTMCSKLKGKLHVKAYQCLG